jgi:two-component system nitrogen regulation response regulator GlnG
MTRAAIRTNAPEDVETVDSRSVAERSRDPAEPCLTVLYHPDLSRIGERVVLGPDSRRVELSRLAPGFAAPGRTRAAALGDSHLSRRPLVVSWRWPDGLELVRATSSTVIADGRRIDQRASFAPAAVRRGVIIELAHRVVLLAHLVDGRPRAPATRFLGDSDGIERVRRAIAQVADLDVPVLIRGETGTGKEQVAHEIHARSRRAGGPCVSVNMAAVPEATAASILFGHARGAFTGAVSRHVGLFEAAHGGTLFLDEIGDTPESVQTMLLRALDTRTILPVGEAEERRVDVRVIAATDADLEAGAAGNGFRAALLHRLRGFQIDVPPLRERLDDIPRLALSFLRDELAATGELERLRAPCELAEPWLPPWLMTRLVAYPWPGNVRELRNAVRTIAIASRGEPLLRADLAPAAPRAAGGPGSDRTLPDDDALVAALRAHRWALRPTAVALGIPRATLYDLIERSPRLRMAKQIEADELAACHAECGGDLTAMQDRLRVSRAALKARLKEVGLAAGAARGV